MNRRALLAAALALPLVGLGASWGLTHGRAQQGTEWEVRVTGYDPRDLLQGHYVEYRYEWPGLDRDAPGGDGFFGSDVLCLHGTAPRIDKVTLPGNGPCLNRVRAERGQVSAFMGPLVGGRYYAGQARAEELGQKLANGDFVGTLRFRLREDGHLTPLDLTFRPKTATEKAAEEAAAAAEADAVAREVAEDIADGPPPPQFDPEI